MTKVTELYVREKEVKHSIRYKNIDPTSTSLVDTVYVKRVGIQNKFGDVPKQISITVETNLEVPTNE